jgi:hypothetical protein
VVVPSVDNSTVDSEVASNPNASDSEEEGILDLREDDENDPAELVDLKTPTIVGVAAIKGLTEDQELSWENVQQFQNIYIQAVRSGIHQTLTALIDDTHQTLITILLQAHNVQDCLNWRSWNHEKFFGTLKVLLNKNVRPYLNESFLFLGIFQERPQIRKTLKSYSIRVLIKTTFLNICYNISILWMIFKFAINNHVKILRNI